MVGSCGLPVVFWFHSFVCLAGTVFAFVFLPETQGPILRNSISAENVL
jgi:hypothetical protein